MLFMENWNYIIFILCTICKRILVQPFIQQKSIDKSFQISDGSLKSFIIQFTGFLFLLMSVHHELNNAEKETTFYFPFSFTYSDKYQPEMTQAMTNLIASTGQDV